MSPKQRALAENIPRFIRKIDASGADYHVGIVTSDVGTTPTEGQPPQGWEGFRCSSYKGDDGRLQAKPCTERTTGTSAEFRTACNSLCPDGSFIPRADRSGRLRRRPSAGRASGYAASGVLRDVFSFYCASTRGPKLDTP